jgi:hypothetical protein
MEIQLPICCVCWDPVPRFWFSRCRLVPLRSIKLITDNPIQGSLFPFSLSFTLLLLCSFVYK